LLFQEVRHLAGFLVEDKSLEKLGVVYISISILFSVFLIILRVLKSLPFLRLKVPKEHSRQFIKPSKDSVVNNPKAKRRCMIGVGSCNNQNLCDLKAISFGSH